jgi:hypothetical protein
VRVKYFQTGSDGRGTTLMKTRRLHKSRPLQSHVATDGFRLMPHNDHYVIEEGCLRTPDNPAEHGRILPREKLFGPFA